MVQNPKYDVIEPGHLIETRLVLTILVDSDFIGHETGPVGKIISYQKIKGRPNARPITR
jgi:hypothetical protein